MVLEMMSWIYLKKKRITMGKVKNYLQEKAEDFMHKVEQKVSQKKISKGCALMLCLAEEDIAWELVGFDTEYWPTLKSDISSWIESIEVKDEDRNKK